LTLAHALKLHSYIPARFNSTRMLRPSVQKNWMRFRPYPLISVNVLVRGLSFCVWRCVLAAVVFRALSHVISVVLQRQFWMRKYITSSAFKRIRSVVVIASVILSLLVCLYTVL
jgi:hypothetical protein